MNCTFIKSWFSLLECRDSAYWTEKPVTFAKWLFSASLESLLTFLCKQNPSFEVFEKVHVKVKPKPQYITNKYIIHPLCFLLCFQTIGQMEETSRAPRCLCLSRSCHPTIAPGRLTQPGRDPVHPASPHHPGNFKLPSQVFF